MKRILTLLLLLLGYAGNCLGQVIVQGYTYNERDRSAVEYTSIELYDKSKGTLSNDHGYFELRLDSLPALIKVTCLGYETKMVSVPDTSFLDIALNPTIIRLKEIEVRYQDFVTSLVASAHDKAYQSRKNVMTGKAFYRQFNSNDSVCTEILELFYNVCTNNNGIKAWTLTQARYGIKDVDTGSRLYVYNQSSITKFLKIYNDESIDLGFPLPISNPKRQRILYDLENQYHDYQTGQNIVEVAFRSIKSKNDTTYGHLFIDEDNLNILKVKGVFIDKANRFLQPTSWERQYMDKIKNTRLDYEIRFKKLGENFLVVDYIKVKVSLSAIYKKKTINLTSESFFYVYENDPSLKVPDSNPEVNDYEAVKRTSYDPVFWFNNPIIKRNPIEQRLINEFERENIIGNLLN